MTRVNQVHLSSKQKKWLNSELSLSFESFTDLILWLPRTLFLVLLEVPEFMNTHVLHGGPPTRRAPTRSRSTWRKMYKNPRLSTETRFVWVSRGLQIYRITSPKKYMNKQYLIIIIEIQDYNNRIPDYDQSNGHWSDHQGPQRVQYVPFVASFTVEVLPWIKW